MRSLFNPHSISVLLTAALFMALGSVAYYSYANPEPPADPYADLPVRKEGRKVIHAFVALCDNENQGIQPVPAKIGNGKDLENNLYWGNNEGLAGWFGKNARWKLLRTVKTGSPEISEPVLERRIFQHVGKDDAILVADAYDGAAMKQCLTSYYQALAGNSRVVVSVNETEQVAAGGSADLVSFTGHNGLMELTLNPPIPHPQAKTKPTVVFCCQSERFFAESLAKMKAVPLVMTQQNMYPGAFLLDAAYEEWLAGKTATDCTAAVASAYAKNQNIPVKSAKGVFWKKD